MADQKLTGTVKRWNADKGYGFISPSSGGDDVFVHQTAIKADGFRSLAEGESVEFTIMVGDDGRSKAQNVTGPNGSNVQGAPRQQSYGGYGGYSGGGGYS